MTYEKKDKKILNWTPLQAIGVTILTYFASQFAAVFIVAAFPSSQGWTDAEVSKWLNKNNFAQFAISIIATAIILGLVYWFIRRKGSKVSDIGLKGKPKFNDLKRAVIAYVLYFFIYVLMIYSIKKLIPSIDLKQKQEIGFETASKLQLPLVFCSLVLFPAFMEEVVMRGFLYSSLKQSWKRNSAIVVTSFLFAIAHLQFGSGAPLLWVAAIDTFILSLFLIHLKDKDGRLWAPIFLHGIKNLVAFLFIFIL